MSMPLDSYKTLCRDSSDEAGFTINPRLILQMRLEKAEAPCSEIRLELKRQTRQDFIDWLRRLLSNSKVAKTLNEVRIKKALTQAHTIIIHRTQDFEFLSWWSIESHTFMGS